MTHALYFVVPQGRSQLIDSIAGSLLDDPLVDRVGCVVETRSDRQFLTADSDVPYDRVDLAPDLSPGTVEDDTASPSDTPSIDEIRAAYGMPFLTPFVVSDERYDGASRTEWRTLVERAFGYFERVLDRFDPTVVVTPNIRRPFEWVPARVASTDGTYLWWKTTRVGSRYGLIEGTHQEAFCGIHGWENGEHAETTDEKRNAEQYLADVRESGSRPNFYARRADTYGDSLLEIVFPYGIPTPRELGILFRRRVSGHTDFDDRRLPRARNVVRRLRIRMKDTFESPRSEERFVFFPLHAQPEPSTRLNAPLFENQITLAEQIVKSLPVDCYLYIKDHPRMFRDNTRSPAYYTRLAEMSGVRVLNPNADSHGLIRESKAVVSVVGTPAMEAAFFNTPSIVFGPAHFTALSSVRRCWALDELPDLLSWALSASGAADAELVAYLSLLFEHTFDLPAAARGSSSDAQRLMADCVAPELRSRLRTMI